MKHVKPTPHETKCVYVAESDIGSIFKYLANRGCYPCLCKRGGKWRFHVNASGNYWAEAYTPELAMEKALKSWEKAKRPLDGLADS